jgi:hypothetical protein
MLTQHHKLKKINKCNENTLKTIDISYNRYAFNDLRRDVIVCFVDIGGIVDHHYLNSIFIRG